jgi:hypothetical protein
VIAPGRSDEDMRSLFLNPHKLELLERFNSSGVRYLIIGGHAVQFHGYLRTAKDLDIFIDRSHDNAELIVCALCYLGFSGTDLTAELFCEPKKQIPLGRYQAELLTSPDGPPFGEAYDRRVIANEREIPAGDVDLGAQPPAAGSPHRAGCEGGWAGQRQDPPLL